MKYPSPFILPNHEFTASSFYPLSLRRLVQEAIDQHRLAAKTKGISISLIASQPILVQGDPLQLTHLIGEMLQMAINKTSPERGLAIILRKSFEQAFVCLQQHANLPSSALDQAYVIPLYREKKMVIHPSTFYDQQVVNTCRRIVKLHQGFMQTYDPQQAAGKLFECMIPCE